MSWDKHSGTSVVSAISNFPPISLSLYLSLCLSFSILSPLGGSVPRFPHPNFIRRRQGSLQLERENSSFDEWEEDFYGMGLGHAQHHQGARENSKFAANRARPRNVRKDTIAQARSSGGLIFVPLGVVNVT